jgi:Tfp pilus assembly protein PilX
MSRTRRQSIAQSRGDEGVALTMVLLVVIVFGLIAAAVAAYATTNFRRSTVTRQRTEKVNSADSGLRYAIDRIRLDSTLCSKSSSLATGENFSMPQMLNSKAVTINCKVTSGLPLGINGFAVVLTGQTATTPVLINTQGGSSRDKVITGPVFVQTGTDTLASKFNLQADLRLKQGYLFSYDPGAADCSTKLGPVGDPRLAFEPADVFGPVACNLPWSQVVAPPALGTAPTTPASYTDLASCRVFTPGVMRNVSVPLKQGGNYFQSGVYYFDNVGHIDLTKAVVTGGRPGPGDTQVLANPGCAGAPDTSGANETGVVWILGGNSWIDVGNQGSLELFRRCSDRNACATPASAGLNNVSIVQVGTGYPGSATGTGYNPSSLSASSSPALTTKSGNTNDMVIHGEIYTPHGVVGFGNVTNTVYGQSLGGLVASWIDLDASASASNFVIQLDTGPFVRSLRVTSTASDAKGVSIATTADIEVGNGDGRPAKVTSWRVAPA